MAEGLENSYVESYKTEAMTELRNDYGKYLEALEKHPRLLVGQEVPAIGREGMETLRDSADAQEWQEAVKAVLTDELRSRVHQKADANQGTMQMLHGSLDLFRNNADLIPGTTVFDKELADEFARMAKPYEFRTEDGKLLGYNIPVQPLVENIRESLKTARAAKVASAPAAEAAASAAPAKPKPKHTPQAGISSKAGNSGEEPEDFSTFWGTLGLPNLKL